LNKSLMQLEKASEMKPLLDEERFMAWPRAKQNMFWLVEAIYKEMFEPRKVKLTKIVDHPMIAPTFRMQVEASLVIRL